jgi:hypothetical protein
VPRHASHGVSCAPRTVHPHQPISAYVRETNQRKLGAIDTRVQRQEARWGGRGKKPGLWLRYFWAGVLALAMRGSVPDKGASMPLPPFSSRLSCTVNTRSSSTSDHLNGLHIPPPHHPPPKHANQAPDMVCRIGRWVVVLCVCVRACVRALCIHSKFSLPGRDDGLDDRFGGPSCRVPAPVSQLQRAVGRWLA